MCSADSSHSACPFSSTPWATFSKHHRTTLRHSRALRSFIPPATKACKSSSRSSSRIPRIFSIVPCFPPSSICLSYGLSGLVLRLDKPSLMDPVVCGMQQISHAPSLMCDRAERFSIRRLTDRAVRGARHRDSCLRAVDRSALRTPTSLILGSVAN